MVKSQNIGFFMLNIVIELLNSITHVELNYMQ